MLSVLEGKPKGSIIKDQFASNTPEDVAVMLRPLKRLPGETKAGAIGCISSLRWQKTRFPCSKERPMRKAKNLVLGRDHGTVKGLQKAWRPPSGGARRDRTDDLVLAKHALSQLSYGPFPGAKPKGQIRECALLGPVEAKMVGLGRLELPTSRLSSARSNQLSYKPQAQASPCAKPPPAA